MLWLVLAAVWAAPPDVDSPLRTGVAAPDDAALVVGVEDYFKLPDVPYAVRDAEAFHDWLIHTRGVPLDRTRLRTDGANREQILADLAELAAVVGPEGVLWVYFAGHGAASPTDGGRMLLGADVQTDRASFEARSVHLSEIRDASGEGRLVLVLDTCYAGKGRGGQELLEGQRFAVPTWARDLGSGDVVQWTAASENELSGPLEPARHGAFTYFVLGALRGWADGALDDQRDGQVTAAEARAWVTAAMLSVQVTDQHPVLQATDASQWVLSRGELEPAPTLDATTWSPAQQDAGYLDVVARRRAEEQRIRDELAALEAEHGARVARRVEELEAEASAEWARVEAVAEVDAAVGAEAISAFLRRWQGRTELVEGELVPVPVVEVGEASALGAALRRRLSQAEAARQAVWGARVQDLQARVGEAVRGEQERARQEWSALDASDPLALEAYASRWEGHTIEIEGVDFPVPVGEATRARVLLHSGAGVEHPDQWVSPTIGYRFLRVERDDGDSLFVGRLEVSQRQWEAVMHDDHWSLWRNMSADGGDPELEVLVGGDRPAHYLTWSEAVAFCNTLSVVEGLKPAYRIKPDGTVRWNAKADGYRLPTPEEWAWLVPESALSSGCRANLYDALGEQVYATYVEGERGSYACTDGWPGPADVGSFEPDDRGLYDLEGNVAEWGWGEQEGEDRDGNPATLRPFFGSSFFSPPEDAVPSRIQWVPRQKSWDLGLRLVRSGE